MKSLTPFLPPPWMISALRDPPSNGPRTPSPLLFPPPFHEASCPGCFLVWTLFQQWQLRSTLLDFFPRPRIPLLELFFVCWLGLFVGLVLLRHRSYPDPSPGYFTIRAADAFWLFDASRVHAGAVIQCECVATRFGGFNVIQLLLYM